MFKNMHSITVMSVLVSNFQVDLVIDVVDAFDPFTNYLYLNILPLLKISFLFPWKFF